MPINDCCFSDFPVIFASYAILIPLATGNNNLQKSITKLRFHINIYSHQVIHFITVVVPFLFLTLIVCFSAGLTIFKMMFLKHLQGPYSTISFPETYHFLVCNLMTHTLQNRTLVIMLLRTCDSSVAKM